MKKNQETIFFSRRKWEKILFVMKLKLILILISSFQLSAAVYSQGNKVTLKMENTSLEQVIWEIQKQTDFVFMYGTQDVSKVARLTVDMKDKTVNEILNLCLRNTGLIYMISGNAVIIKRADDNKKETTVIKGVVRDQKGEPLPGVTIIEKGTSIGVATGINGDFTFSTTKRDSVTLLFSFVGMKTKEVTWKGEKMLSVVMEEEVSEMEEVVITGYQVVDRRKNTSAVTSVKVGDIMIPGVSSIDKMLEGRIPDMVFMTNSGEVGVVPKIRIRGTSTLIGNREPLWVVDGIIVQDPVNIEPETLNDPDYINRIGNAIAGLNPQDIERLDILKDAAATALYGTKAANGVIVITTKRGHVGRPVVTYNMNTTMRQRPRYTDRQIKLMNSKERIQFSRDLMAVHYQYPEDMAMVGYEKLVTDLYNHTLSSAQFEKEVSYLETLNTDWFDLLTEDSFSHQHTLSISGGSQEARYYASIGYTRDNDVVKTNRNERYTAALNLDANLTSWLTASVGLNGNVSSRDYYQEEVSPINYAYKTSRTIPVYTEEGDYSYYIRKQDNNSSANFNILNELDNSSYTQEGNSLTLNANLKFKFTDWLNANAIASYSVANTIIEGYWGEKMWHAALLRGTEYGVLPDPYHLGVNDFGVETWVGGTSLLPYGGELTRKESDNRTYTVRLQLNANKYLGLDDQHNINASVGYEMSSTRYKGYDNITRGYYPDRGKTIVNNVNLTDYPTYANWLAANVPVITDNKNNTVSLYASVSYSYYNYFTLNANARVDGSNKFGDRSNDKLLPIWSVSGAYNISEHDWMQYNWIDYIRLKASFGYQGNMLSDQSPTTIISKKPTNAYFGEPTSTIKRYPNPNLKWEKTTSYNLGLEFSLFQNKLQVEASCYWKHIEDAFMKKTIASVNGVEGNSYIVNGGDVDNSGYSFAFTVSPINTEDFRWTFSTSFSKLFNKMKSNPASDEYELSDFLDGTALVKGKAVGTFYSYKFLGLSPEDGGPLFDDYADHRELLRGLSKYDTYTRVLKASGRREPTVSGSLNTSLRWKNIRLSGSFAYSLGNKVRLFAMYSAADATFSANEIRPEHNVSRDYLKRWQHSGDERYTTIPAIITQTSDAYQRYSGHWSTLTTYYNKDIQPIANSAWEMYDYGSHRVVSGNYLKCSNLSVTYQFPQQLLDKMRLSRLELTLSGANLFTICSRELNGQAPTQSGFATIQLSDRPQYSFGLCISF